MTHTPDGEQAGAGLAALLDDLRARGSIPAGMRGRLYAILDGLRSTGAPPARVQSLERIALTIHGLEWARLRKAADEEEALWRQLDVQTSEWAGISDSTVRSVER